MPEAVVLEEHSSVLGHWMERDCRDRTLVCLNAHLDLQRIGDVRLNRLRTCTSPDDVRRLEKAHHLLPDGCSSFGIHDFLYAARAMGMIRRLVWVAPPHVRTGDDRAEFVRLQQMDGVGLDDLTSFHRADDGSERGRLLGLDLTVCSLFALPCLDLPDNALLDIDIDYFVTVPGDTGWIDPETVYGVLRELPVAGQPMTISRSVGSGFTPLRYRYLADYLAALWEGRRDDISRYRRLHQLTHQLVEGDRDGAMSGCLEMLRNQTGSAAVHYLLSLADPDPARSDQARRTALALDPAYDEDALVTTCAILNRRLPVDARRVHNLERRLDALPSGLRLSLAHAALGLLMSAGGQVARAVGYYRKWEAENGPHPELAMEIGKLLLQSPEPESAELFLHAAESADASRTASCFYLGQLHIHRGDWANAVRCLEQVIEAAPAWVEAMELELEAYRRLGRSDRAVDLQERIGSIERALG